MVFRILIIDDEATICQSLKEGLSDMGYETDIALNGETAILQIGEFKPHMVMLDLRLGGENGIELISKLKLIDPDVLVMMMTAYGDVQTAVAAIKAGAFDYIHKPFGFDEIDLLIKKGIAHINTLNKLQLFEQSNITRNKYMIGDDISNNEVHKRIAAVSQSDKTTVLIQGETGTGKELVAAAIHGASSRKNAVYVKINCGAIPDHLVESELFGFEKNAFTGASARKKGLFEMADGGTIFLDEIGELPIELQSKLLRFLEDQKFKRLGGLSDITVDVQILAATNKDLIKAIKEKSFREDLFYRLNVFPITLTPLRNRGNDVCLLAEFFAASEAKKYYKKVPLFSDDVKRCFKTYNWPGNIRELRNVIERTMLLHQVDVIEKKHLPPEIAQSDTDELINDSLKLTTSEPLKSIDLVMTSYESVLSKGGFSLEKELRKIEQGYLETALKLSGMQMTKAAELLNISRFALKRKLEKN